MLFTTPVFLFAFLPITFLVFYFSTKAKNLTSLWLLISSFIFYIAWNPWDLIPLCLSIGVNYGIYSLMIAKDRCKRYLIIGIVFNLLFLCFYKYSGQFFKKVLHADALDLPLGISFFTFTQIAFLADHYKNHYEKNDLINYSLFVSYFPHLVCGPIISFKKIYPQLTQKYNISWKNIAYFVFFFSVGFFKKLVIADPLGDYVDDIFSYSNQEYSFYTSSCATLCYAIQLFADFSGYSDMAVGISYLFGIEIPDNFDAPYRATSIIDFWRRWHISLSQFLRDYVYIPLGGNKNHRSFNLWATMVLGGLWHGGSWHFVWWGIFHGTLLWLNHLWRTLKPPSEDFIVLKRMGVFILVCFGWILFRSPNMNVATKILKGFSHFTNPTYYPWVTWDDMQKLAVGLGLFLCFGLPNTRQLLEKYLEKKYTVRVAFLCGFLVAFSCLYLNKMPHFLYAGF